MFKFKVKERSVDYISGEVNFAKTLRLAAITILSKTRHLSYNMGEYVGIEVSMAANDEAFVLGFG